MISRAHKGARRAETLLWSILGVLVTSLAFGGFSASEYLSSTYYRRAEAAEVSKAFAAAIENVDQKLQYILDLQIEALVVRVDYLRNKADKSALEKEQLQYAEKQLELAKKVRAIK